MGISREQALDCLRSDDLIGIGMEADAVRRRLHPEGVVSYVVGGRVCCGGLGAATEEAVAKIYAEIRTTVEMGGSCVRLAGWDGKNDRMSGLGEIELLLQGIRQRIPSIWVEGLTTAEVAAVARESGLGVGEVLARLRDAGLNSIADDGVRVGHDMAFEWVEIHRAAHGVGMRTAAAITFGASEEGVGMERLVDAMEAVRRLQEETGGFVAFIPQSFAPEDGGNGYGAEEPTAVEYLKVLAVSRMVLDSVENVEAGVSGRGLKVLQSALRFGANDAGWLIQKGNSAREEDLRRVARDAGFRPVERDAAYRTMFLS
jgi:cyclic dehypoxanthinyl futalosine synthase